MNQGIIQGSAVVVSIFYHLPFLDVSKLAAKEGNELRNDGLSVDESNLFPFLEMPKRLAWFSSPDFLLLSCSSFCVTFLVSPRPFCSSPRC
jgi:hypothetical protein